MRDIDEIFIHCADTPDSMDIGASEIDDWHKQRGWSGIGYHFVIRRNGDIENGRPLKKSGAHVRGHNAKSIGICLVGREKYSDPQWTSLKHLIGDLLDTFPKAEVKGHYQADKKKPHCPGFNVPEWYHEHFMSGDQFF